MGLNNKSEMWERLIVSFSRDKNSTQGLERFRGYDFSDSGNVSFKTKVYLFLEATLYLWLRLIKAIYGRFTETSRSRFRYYASAVVWLKRNGLYADYVETCKRLGVSDKHFGAAKSFYVSKLVTDHLPREKGVAPIGLEIGSGTGNLTTFLLVNSPLKKLILIDFEEMLEVAEAEIRRRIPNLDKFVVSQWDEFLAANTNANCILTLTPRDVDLLETGSVNIIMNVDSLQEMTREQVETYHRFIERVLAKGGVWLNINRRKYLEREGFDNNPLLYPQIGNRYVFENDSFFTDVCNANGVRKDGWVLSIATKLK